MLQYAFDIQGWLEDCLDEIDMREEYETLLKMCNDLIELFGWPEYSGSDIKFRKAAVLLELGKTKEVVEFCEKWMRKESENVVAATAGVYAYIDTKEYDKAIERYDEYVEEYFLNPDFDEDEELPFN